VTAAATHSGACGRFAPSPTGPLHFGSLVAALASYCDARAQGGRWLVRMEDVDTSREQPGAADGILATLALLGMTSDLPVVKQSARTALYEQALATLVARDVVFECACTRSELALAATASSVPDERVYPGNCRHGIAPERAQRAARALRVRVDGAEIEYIDRVQGPQRQALASVAGDFVVRRSDGLFAYQLAVVVDDAAQGVTSVVRGADLLPVTPRQILLQQHLGLPQPQYLHVPVAVNAQGEKLSKQTGAQALAGNPLASLRAAWTFLQQPEPAAATTSLDAFWTHAAQAWSVTHIPRVTELPCPAQFA
jgi:glutamyl-Q tRNA(Asp) synthetase